MDVCTVILTHVFLSYLPNSCFMKAYSRRRGNILLSDFWKYKEIPSFSEIMLIVSLTYYKISFSFLTLVPARASWGVGGGMREHFPWEPPLSSKGYSSFSKCLVSKTYASETTAHHVMFATTVNLAQIIYFEEFQTGAKV